jgi:hypothetical protein
MYKLVPHKVILVGSIPQCNFCSDGTPGPYDFKTVYGSWGNGCEKHYIEYRSYTALGMGMGQLWVTEDQVDWTPLEKAKREAAEARRKAAS